MTAPTRQTVWFLLPWATGFVVLTLLPMLASLGLSFTKVGPVVSADRITWVGISQYRTALGVDRTYEPTPRGVRTSQDPFYWRLLGGRPEDSRLYSALYNSLFYTVLAVPLGLCMSLVVALLLNHQARGMSVIRACVYLPHLLGGVATIVIWSWLFNPRFGWINQVIRYIYALLDPVVRLFAEGGTQAWPVPNWLYSPAGCKPALIVMYIWTMGGSMLIFLAARRRIAQQLYDAASLDGAGAWCRFRHVTLPQITPAVLLNLIISIVFAMQSFSEPYLLQNRQQDDGLLFYMLYLYEVAFEPPYRLGYASALAWILVAVLVVLIVPLMWSSRRWVHYATSE